jgi:hypothetical protein
MEPISLLLIALFASATTAAAVLALLTWSTVDSFIRSKAVPAGTATVIQKQLASGNYSVVVGVFGRTGSKIASQSWEAQTLDSTLRTKLGGKNALTIRT